MSYRPHYGPGERLKTIEMSTTIPYTVPELTKMMKLLEYEFPQYDITIEFCIDRGYYDEVTPVFDVCGTPKAK